MFEENIEFIRKSVAEGNPFYGTISLLADTFDAMRSATEGDFLTAKTRPKYKKAIGKILDGMTELDNLIGNPN